MKKDKLNRLIEVLSVPTHSMQEDLMIEYLEKVFTEKGYKYKKDELGNLYVTKGDTEFFPCFIAHTDTVHSIDLNLKIIEDTKGEDKILRGINSVSEKPSGCGGDDKCGVYLALEMLDTLPNVKVAFFIGEEIGCVGSSQADVDFFKNVGYVIQYDSPKGFSMSYTLMGKYLYEDGSPFAHVVEKLLVEHGVNEWSDHPYTDISSMLAITDVCCLNLPAGYYNYHTKHEYVIIDDVQNGYDMGISIVEQLGETKHSHNKKDSGSAWGGGRGSVALLEAVKRDYPELITE